MDASRKGFEKIARKFIRTLTAHYIIKKVILFGSRARGDYLKMSDFDFIIVSPDFKGVHFTKRIKEGIEIELLHGSTKNNSSIADDLF